MIASETQIFSKHRGTIEGTCFRKFPIYYNVVIRFSTVWQNAAPRCLKHILPLWQNFCYNVSSTMLSNLMAKLPSTFSQWVQTDDRFCSWNSNKGRIDWRSHPSNRRSHLPLCIPERKKQLKSVIIRPTVRTLMTTVLHRLLAFRKSTTLLISYSYLV